MARGTRRAAVAAVAAFAVVGLSACTDAGGSLTAENIGDRVSEAFYEAGSYRFEFSSDADQVRGAISYADGEVVALHLVEQFDGQQPQEYRYVDGQLFVSMGSSGFATADAQQVEQVVGWWDYAAVSARLDFESADEVGPAESGGVEVTEYAVNGTFES